MPVTPGQEWILEGVADVTFEDSGAACLAEIHHDVDGDQDNGVFVRFQSWQEGGRQNHEIADLHGRTVRVHITVL